MNVYVRCLFNSLLATREREKESEDNVTQNEIYKF